MNKDNFFDSISTLKGVGPQLSKYLKKCKKFLTLLPLLQEFLL